MFQKWRVLIPTTDTPTIANLMLRFACLIVYICVVGNSASRSSSTQMRTPFHTNIDSLGDSAIANTHSYKYKYIFPSTYLHLHCLAVAWVISSQPAWVDATVWWLRHGRAQQRCVGPHVCLTFYIRLVVSTARTLHCTRMVSKAWTHAAEVCGPTCVPHFLYASCC